MSGLSAIQHCDGKNVVQQLATYIVKARETPYPKEAADVARKCIIDAFIAAAAGANSSGPKAIRNTAALFYPGKVPIWFTNKASSFIAAAWANASAIAALDIDDGNAYARGHPGAAVVSTALAVGQEMGASWDDIITAIVIGYQVGVVVGTARKTYGNTGTWSSYAVVATAAALRDTKQVHIEHALAIAGENAPNQLFMSARSNSPTPEGSDVKEGIPWSVKTGLNALLIAEAGHTGPRNILDSTAQYGYPEDLKLDGDLRILQTYFKPYACCRHIHAAMAALRDLLRDHRIDVASITSIEVETNHWAFTLPNKTHPENLSDIQYSVPYCLGLIALVGKEAFVPLTQQALNRDDVTALAEKVKVIRTDDMPMECASMETPARVIVVCGDSRYTSKKTEPEGGVGASPSFDDFEDKFTMASRLVAKAEDQDRIGTSFQALWTGNMRDLMQGLTVNLVG